AENERARAPQRQSRGWNDLPSDVRRRRGRGHAEGRTHVERLLAGILPLGRRLLVLVRGPACWQTLGQMTPGLMLPSKAVARLLRRQPVTAVGRARGAQDLIGNGGWGRFGERRGGPG